MGDMTEPKPEAMHTGKAGVEHDRVHCRPVWCGEFPPEGHPLAATPEEKRLLAEGKDPVQVYRGAYSRPAAVAAPPSSGTWGAPRLPTGLDQFTADQQPNPRPVDDLSRFVMDRIRFAESEPAVDMVPKFYSQPQGAMAHRYAGNVRRDMVAFRRIVAAYCETKGQIPGAESDEEETYLGGQLVGLWVAMLAIATRFADHPDFRDEWRLE